MIAYEWDSVAGEAASLVFGDRGKVYDHPAVDYSRTAELFRAMTGIDLSLREAVAFMVCVKLSRVGAALEHDHPAAMVRDSLVDLAGYADCLFAVWQVETDDDLEDALEGIEE